MTIYKGIDLNSNNNISDWQKIKNAGIQVLINKATEGNYYQDKYLQYRYNTVRPIGIKMGFYHFCGSHGAISEMNYFLNYINGLISDTVLFLDIEQPPKSYGWQWTKQSATNYLNQAIPYLQSKGYKVGIYTGISFYNDFLKGNIPNIVLWLASYGSQPSLYPSSASWQYSERGIVNGADNYIDVDYFIDNIFTGEVKPIPDIPSADVIANAKKFVGSRCLELQQKLNKVGYKLVEDGDFGINTYLAVVDFQKNNGLTVDGMAGSQTFTKLDELINNPEPTPQPQPVNNLSAQIEALQYDLNLDYNAKLIVDGEAGKATLAALQGIQNIIVKGHKSHVVEWIQQKLVGYGYLNKSSYTPMVYDEPTFQAVTNLQKNWNIATSGKFDLSTWNVFLNN